MSWQDIIKDDEEEESDELSKLLDDLEKNYYDLSQLSADGEIGDDAVYALEKAIKFLRPHFDRRM